MNREIEGLKNKLLSLCSVVEENLWKSVKSIKTRDTELAKKIISDDINIDQLEVEVEEECLKILALHQPVAIDLRFIITVLKITNDLERIGDLAVNIAERSEFLSTHQASDISFDFEAMAELTQTMLRKSLDALVNVDPDMAYQVCQMDDDVDQINREMYGQVKKGVLSHPEQIEVLLHLLSISRHLERIADHTTNIAEDVIYMVKGEIVRHQAEKYRPE